MAGRGFDDRGRASAAGKKGAATLKDRFGREHFVNMGKTGGASNRDKHDPDHFKELGKRGGQIRWERERARKAAAAAEQATSETTVAAE
ncbi:MAG: Small hydrophilic plant seed protein [Armatimonadetes bacterium]|jgi:general stress protein YciG|nr:Small hydrophilic plant seed protein [Armatimonadota bacterium]